MKKPVSPNNPCPFLRALVANGCLNEKSEKLFAASGLLAKVGGKTKAEGKVGQPVFFIVAWIANGLGPLRLLKSLFMGFNIDQLRDGPLDKHGAGSRIINADGTINDAELARLDSFAADVIDPETGKTERGLKLAKIHEMMDANFARAEGQRRKIDRKLMDGEWPILLGVMGKGSGADRYLSLEELNKFFREQWLPQRILDRIK